MLKNPRHYQRSYSLPGDVVEQHDACRELRLNRSCRGEVVSIAVPSRGHGFNFLVSRCSRCPSQSCQHLHGSGNPQWAGLRAVWALGYVVRFGSHEEGSILSDPNSEVAYIRAGNRKQQEADEEQKEGEGEGVDKHLRGRAHFSLAQCH